MNKIRTKQLYDDKKRENVKINRSSCSIHKIYGVGKNVDIEMRYFLIEGMILPLQGIKKVTTGCYIFRTVVKFYIRIYYGVIKRYTFSFKCKSERGNILSQLLRCLNCDHR